MIPSPSGVSSNLKAVASLPQAPPAAYGAALSNEQLARELARNPDFQLKPKKKSQLEEQISKIAKAAFFDRAREEFSKGIYTNFVPSLLQDIKSVSDFQLTFY